MGTVPMRHFPKHFGTHLVVSCFLIFHMLPTVNSRRHLPTFVRRTSI